MSESDFKTQSKQQPKPAQAHTASEFSKVSFVEIGPEHEGQRLDNFLIRHLKGVPKSRIYRLLRKGEVRVNKGRVKADTRVKQGDIVRIAPIRVAERGAAPVPGKQLKRYLADNILFEDEGLLIINKPSGWYIDITCISNRAA